MGDNLITLPNSNVSSTLNNTDEEYKNAGVEVVGPGILWNDGYKFKGEEISKEDANFLVLYRYYLGHVVDNLRILYSLTSTP